MATSIATIDDIDYKRAYRAYSNTSFSPDVRARDVRQGYVETIEALYARLAPIATTPEQLDLLLEEVARYKAGYIKHLYAALDAQSRTASPMITGPANFPVARNQKRLATERKRYDEFLEWQQKASEAITRRMLASRSADEQLEAEWHHLEISIDDNLCTIQAIDSGKSYYHRAAFVNSIVGKVERLAAKGEVELVKRAVARVVEYNGHWKKPAIYGRNKFYDLPQVAETARAAQEQAATVEASDLDTFQGGRIVDNPEIDRIQIIFDGKPDEATRAKLRGAGWNWSPRNSAWQRKRTESARESARAICCTLALTE